MFHSKSIPGLSFLLIGLFAFIGTSQRATAQTSNERSNDASDVQTALEQINVDSGDFPQSNRNTSTPPPRRPPATRTAHGSIRGSQANSLADHHVARLLDRISEQNWLGLEFYGYIDQGFTWNPDSPADRTNGPVLFNYRSNAYQMNGLYLVAERKIDPDRDAIQLGGRLDQLYGTDAAFNLTTGLDENIVTDAASSFYKLAYPQAYANLFLPIGRGVSFKVGTFYTPVGNEATYATENFFYSHYLSGNIQPATLTGFLGETQLTETINVGFGPNLGWNTFENSNNSVNYAGRVTWKSTNEHSQIQFAFQDGKQRSDIVVADSHAMIYSLVLNQKLGDRCHYMLEHDLLISNSRTGTAIQHVVFSDELLGLEHKGSCIPLC